MATIEIAAKIAELQELEALIEEAKAEAEAKRKAEEEEAKKERERIVVAHRQRTLRKIGNVLKSLEY